MKLAILLAGALTLSACASAPAPGACTGPNCLTAATAPVVVR